MTIVLTPTGGSSASAATAGDWPAWLIPSSVALALEPNRREFESPFSKAYQAVDLLGERWRMTVTLPPRKRSDAGAVEAFFHRLRGVHTIAAWYFGREQPAGTMRGTPTAASAAAQGASSIVISTSAAATLLAGDMIGVAGQLFMVAADATADSGGLMTVVTVNRVRVAIASGAGVTWYRPSTTWRVMDASVPITHHPGFAEGASIDLMETWT